jgi:hypothetical protein
VPGDPVWAYCGGRAAARKSIEGERRHAVTWFAHISGAHDAECGAAGAVLVGRWDPDDPHNCADCVAYLAGEVPVPEESAALREPDRRSGTLSAFTDAA